MNNILEKIYEFNKETNKFQYGLKFPHKNKIDHRDNTTYEDYKRYYKFASPEEFVKQDGGICWDFVTYEADWFKKNFPNIHYDCYFIIFNNGKDCHTHTFLVFNYNNKYYWFESAFYKFRGIYEADSIKDILNYVIYSMNKYSPKGESLLNYKLYIFKYNALDKNLYGLSDREFINYICNHGSRINHTYSKNYNVRRVTMDNMNEACKDITTARQFVTDVDKLAKKYDANYFIVTDEASGVRNNGNPAVRNARLAQIEWEKNNNEDWSSKVNNGKYTESYINESNVINENLVFSKKDLFYRVNEFNTSDINILLISGFSGSGKSTMAEKICKDKTNWVNVEMDFPMMLSKFSEEKIKNKCPIGYEFLISPDGKKFLNDFPNKDASDDDINKYYYNYIKAFLSYVKSIADKNKDKFYVVDGIWPLLYSVEPEFFKDWAVVIKGTSWVAAIWRRAGRDTDDPDATWLDRVLTFIYLLRPLHYKALGKNVEKNINKYEAYFKKINKYKGYDMHMESTINDINNIKMALSQKERDYIGTNSRADPVYNYVHYIDGKPAGYIAVRVIPRDDCTNAYIELAVHPKYRHKGVAKIMMDKAINDISNQYPDAYIHYNSYHDNKASIAFAEKYGLHKYSTDDKFERFVYKPSIHESLTSKERKAIPQKSFGIPEDRKFPLDSEQHVRSAIHLFGHAEESKKHALAKRILSAARKYNIDVPEGTQVYKYAHNAVKEDGVLLVEYNNELKNLSLDRIHNWMLCESRFIDDNNQIYYMSINEAINNLDEYNNIMYVFTNKYTLYSHSKGKPILVGQISILEDGSYEWLIQYPLVIDESKLLHNTFNELMGGSSINPVVGRNTGYIINTGQNLIYTMDPTSDRGLMVDDDNHLTLSDIPDEPVYELYQFIGPMGYVNRLNALYKNETTVNNVYTALCGDEYTENALSNNPLFRRIDLELIEQRMLSEIASFNRSIEELRNNVIVECNIIDTMITKPLFFSKYNKFNDISIKEDCDGYFFYSSLSNKRSVSVENISDLSEAMIQSIL